MSIHGKAIGKGMIYIEGLEETYSIEEILDMTLDSFKSFCSFLSEKEADRLIEKIENEDSTEFKYIYLFNMLSKIQ